MSMLDGTWPHLVADIGGTHARFAVAIAPLQLVAVQVLACADFPHFIGALRHYLHALPQYTIRHAAVAIANPVTGDWVKMTNHHWAFSTESIRVALQWERLLVLNDFAAQALAIPHLTDHDVVQVGGDADVPPQQAIALIGPGTGLGVSGLLPHGQDCVVLAGEGGHIGFAPANPLEAAIWAHAHERFGHVSAERLLSGAGLVLVYQALCAQKKVVAQQWLAADIAQQAVAGDDALCVAALQVFCNVLGTVAAAVALTLGARGGVYVCGGMVPRFVGFLQASGFRQRFEDQGRMSAYLAAIPVYVVLNPQTGLIGAAAALQRLLQTHMA